MPFPHPQNRLYYGDNLHVLRKLVKDESVDLVYIDPPFNSKRQYFQIYNNIGGEDRALAQAFTDTWVWDEIAADGLKQILENDVGRFTPQSIELIKGFRNVLKEGSLLAYLVSMTLRIVEIHRVLKPSGNFYFHCDPTASHYLKLVMDAVFCGHAGEFRNEIIWCYRKWSVAQKQFVSNHDTIFFYTKTGNNTFNTLYVPVSPGTMKRWKGQKQQAVFNVEGVRQATSIEGEETKNPMADWWEISIINPAAKERLGYPTQKPEALLARIIESSTNEGDIVLDAYCGCGTTVAMAQKLKRRWIGIDITYQSISLILKRLENAFGPDVLATISLDGIPKDMASATALAHKKDDRVRKEFEKWAVLSYSNNRATINQKAGADQGVDGTAYFMTSKTDNEKIIFQVKSGNVGAKDIRDLRGTIEQEKATLGIFITLHSSTGPMDKAAHAAGTYKHITMGRSYNKIQIVTIKEMIEKGVRLEMPLGLEVVKSAARIAAEAVQLNLASTTDSLANQTTAPVIARRKGARVAKGTKGTTPAKRRTGTD